MEHATYRGNYGKNTENPLQLVKVRLIDVFRVHFSFLLELLRSLLRRRGDPGYASLQQSLMRIGHDEIGCRRENQDMRVIRDAPMC